MRAGRVEVKPEDIAWRGPEVVVGLNHDPGVHAWQRQSQPPDFLQRLVGKNRRQQSALVVRPADAQILRPDPHRDLAPAIKRSIGMDG